MAGFERAGGWLHLHGGIAMLATMLIHNWVQQLLVVRCQQEGGLRSNEDLACGFAPESYSDGCSVKTGFPPAFTVLPRHRRTRVAVRTGIKRHVLLVLRDVQVHDGCGI